MLHFTREEFESRRARVRAEMEARDLDAMLLFAPESHFWTTGYDTFGYCFFQCLLIDGDGEVLLTRSADLRQAELTSTLDDVRVWKDGAGVDPSADLKALLEERGLKGKRLGFEDDTAGLTAKNFRLIEARLDGFTPLIPASDLIEKLRLIKSPAEIAHVRKAGEITDACYLKALDVIGPGADEGAILAAQQGEVFAMGGDYAGNEFIIGSGEHALLCRYYSGRRRLDANDQITLEWAGAYAHYHVAAMRTVVVGTPRPEHISMHAAAKDALLACEAALKPGDPMSEVFDAHATTLDRAGFGAARLNACGYSLGAKYSPCWMDTDMFYEGAPQIMAPGMVFFLHMILMDSDTGAAMTLGRTSLITEGGAEPLSKLSLELPRR
ncbi:MAG: Xaa-Pro peptidase family protein [Pseudomonadota bacterium]